MADSDDEPAGPVQSRRRAAPAVPHGVKPPPKRRRQNVSFDLEERTAISKIKDTKKQIAVIQTVYDKCKAEGVGTNDMVPVI